MINGKLSCAECIYKTPAITANDGVVMRHSCSAPFDMSNAPAAIVKHYLEWDYIATDCVRFEKAK